MSGCKHSNSPKVDDIKEQGRHQNEETMDFIYIAARSSRAFISGCGSKNTSGNATGEEKKTLHISFNPGPYSDQFKNGVAPYLEKKGYTITYKEFTDGVQPNVAVAKGILMLMCSSTRSTWIL